MNLNKTIKYAQLVALTCMASGLASCSLWHDDLDPCAVAPRNYATVNIIYDYNTDERDLMAEHVGAVTLYLFNSDGELLQSIERANFLNQNVISSGNLAFEFDDSSLEAGKSYQLLAIAHGNHGGYAAALANPSLSFRHENADFSNLLDYRIGLERGANGAVDHHNCMIDTLWTSLSPVQIEVPAIASPKEGDPQEPDRHLAATVRLMRVTNMLTLNFWQEDFPTEINPSDYEISLEFPHGNGRLTFDGSVDDDAPTTYQPFALDRVDMNGNKGVCARIGFSRIMLNSGAELKIRNKNTGHVTTVENLASILAAGKEAYNASWTDQEYLDRQYDFALTLPLGDAIPKWVDVSVNILSWTKRINLVEL